MQVVTERPIEVFRTMDANGPRILEVFKAGDSIRAETYIVHEAFQRKIGEYTITPDDWNYLRPVLIDQGALAI